MNNGETHVCAPEIATEAFKSPELFFEKLSKNIRRSVNVSLPCRVISYDRKTHKATLEVMFNWKLVNEGIIEGCYIRDITIVRMMAGGFLIELPISCGDTGWLVACDRDAYDIMECRNKRLAMSAATNSFKSGFWIPDQFGEAGVEHETGLTTDVDDVDVDDSDACRLVIQSANGRQRVSIGDDTVKIAAPNVVIDSKTTTIKSETTYVNGSLKVKGGATGIITETTTATVQNGLIIGIN